MPRRTSAGIHHVTAITRDVDRNIDFYTQVLGLRLVKRTRNFNDEMVEHLYYGDWSATPGTLMTFFAWPEGEAGRQGIGAIGEVAFTIPQSSLGFWIGHLIRHRVRYSGPVRRFGESLLSFQDPDGMLIELVAASQANALPGWEGGVLPAQHSIRGIHHVTLWSDAPAATEQFLSEVMGFQRIAEQDNHIRYATGEGGPGAWVELRNIAGFWQAELGIGSVHHVAWRTPNLAHMHLWQDTLSNAGYSVTPVLDRNYFKSIYVQEPGGVIFEIATDGPGMTVDEPLESLGSQLLTPPNAVSELNALARTLPPIFIPRLAENEDF